MTERDATWWYDGVDGRVSADRDAFRALLRQRDALREQIAGLTVALGTAQHYFDSTRALIQSGDASMAISLCGCGEDEIAIALAAHPAPTPKEMRDE